MLYYLYGLFEDRRVVAQSTVRSTVEAMHTVLAEAQKIEQRAMANQAHSDALSATLLGQFVASDPLRAPPTVVTAPTVPVVPEPLESESSLLEPVVAVSEPARAEIACVPLAPHAKDKGKKKGKNKGKKGANK